MTASAPVGTAEGRALDLHEGITTPPAGCPRWSGDLALRSSHGELVRGRCRATNLCAYCAKLAAVENSELLWLDALQGQAPTMWLVLTTPSASREPGAFYGSRRKLTLALRRRWPACQWAALVEFTTGYGPRSGGKRRPHWNVFLKGIPDDDLEEVRGVVEKVWCAREGASPAAQSVELARNVAAVIRYVALHFQKESQSPPPGWKGHRFLKSRGYLWQATPAARVDAQASLRLKRELWRAERGGLRGSDAHEVATAAVASAAAVTWTFVVLRSSCPRTEGDRARAAARAARSRPRPRSHERSERDWLREARRIRPVMRR